MAEALHRKGPAGLVVFCLVAAAAVSLWALARLLPLELWFDALRRPDPADARQMLAAYSVLPRLVTSILCGAALGLAGALLQLVLRNPIASPTTLGVEAGANLALSVAMLWAPGLLAFGREWTALAGGLLAVAGVLALSWRKGLAPVSVVLSGLVIGLTCSAVVATLILFKTHYLAGLFMWGSGSLSQQDWSAATFLAPRFVVVAALSAFLVRPLTLLSLDDANARNLGLSIGVARLAALILAVALTACVVSTVGIIGFLGLAAPALAHVAGARRVGARLAWSALLGAALLWLTDQCVQLAAGADGTMLPTGVVTALFGAPLLLWLLPRLRQSQQGVLLSSAGPAPRRSAHAGRVLGCLGVLLVIATILSVMVGRGLDGWHLSLGGELDLLLPLRLPRALAALSAGAMLAVAGCMLQRLTANPMASPEVLGVSAGAAFGFAVALFTLSEVGRGTQLLAASAGALVALLAILALGRGRGGASGSTLLVGIALGALFDAVVTALMADGDPRAVLLLNWMTGSTYAIDAWGAAVTLAAAAGLLILLPLGARWLDIVPLGAGTSLALGLHPRRSQAAILLSSAVLTAIATLIVGPLTFVGLMAPHLARQLGLRRALPEFMGAALAGGLVMVAADWVGRSIAFPWQIPAGLAASMIGCPVLLWLLSRKSS
ncbi:iron complex transport system permease protein [Bosea sp. BE125]|uniref:Fe(3+)-hydroxamate ABC transporter permease FhuB n=1 Tax=Bosea sp. BE125 TaxID=2817909 RepID=UPI002867647F|nr:Fe(3+)-hydroxamate ABC transporter permease FhuB [Bosea sp. BE125]MDR6869337.1 iron complex transport system permease protein [Bosea sp. BE125]